MTPKQALADAKAATKSGDLATAIALYQSILKSAPKHSAANAALKKLQKQTERPVTRPEVEHLAGLMQQGAFTKAEMLIGGLLARAPQLAFLHLQKGIIAGTKGKSEQAVQAFEKALELNPNLQDARGNLAIALGDLGRYGDALEVCETSLKHDPKNGQIWLAKSEFLLNLGQDSEALEAAEQATTLQPKFAQAWEATGMIHANSGRKEMAVDALNMALEIEPTRLTALVELTRIQGKDTSKNTIKTLHDFLDIVGPGDFERSVVSFALADVADKQGEIEQAFRLYKQGNGLRATVSPYNHSQDLKVFKAQKNLFEGKGLRQLPEADPTLPRPIFIVGMNRSGTSLIEQILAGHSEVYGAGELDLVDQFANASEGRLDRFSADVIQAFRDSYLGDLASRSEKPVITDKMPANYRWIGLLLAAFPNAQIVHLNRDARDVCFSNFKASFGSSGHAYCYDIQALAQNYRLHLDYMAMWNRLFPNQIKTIQYEEFVAETDDQSKSLLHWLGLPWEPQVLEFHKLDRAVRTMSKGQVHQGVYTSAIKSWAPYATHLDPLFSALEALGVDSANN